MNLKVGDQAPSFILRNTKTEQVDLGDYKGQNVLVLFFPLAFTGVCTEELCTTRDNFGLYEKLNTQILAISVDSLFTLEKFKSENKLNFPLLSDFNKDVSLAYGALYENFVLDMNGVSKRAAFVIDKEGIVKYAEVLENAGEQPNFSDIKAVLEQIS